MNDGVPALVENALQEWEYATENDSVRSYKNAEGLFLLALKRAGEPIPRIHSLLAKLYYELALSHSKRRERNAAGAMDEAITSAHKHAGIALQHDELEFRAQLIKTYIAGDNVLYLNGGLSNLVPDSSGIDAIFEFAGRAVYTGTTATKVRLSQSKFKEEVEQLISIYNKLDTDYALPAGEFLYMADRLAEIAEFCSENRLFGGKEIYSILANTDVDRLDFNAIEAGKKAAVFREAMNLKTLAEARLMAL